MRPRSIFVRSNGAVRQAIEISPQEFLESLHYGQERFASQEDFLMRCCQQDWIREMNDVLKTWLPHNGTILSIGSGLGEHELLLFRMGFNVTASDFVKGSCDEAMRLFPGFRAIWFDILNPGDRNQYDTVLMLGGMDQYFDDTQLERILQNTKRLLKPRGRLVFAIRHHDNLCTRVIDYVFGPLVAKTQNLKYRLQGRTDRWRKKLHAYARSRKEVIRIAERVGFRLARIGYAGFGVEWTRLAVDVYLTRIYRLLRSIDRRLHCCTNVTLFEFVP